MKVHVHNDAVRQRVLVFVEQGRDDSGRRLFLTEEGAYMAVADMEEPPIYLAIPEYVATAIGEALAPRPEATERHLDDAIVVRDRLLTLVEQLRATA